MKYSPDYKAKILQELEGQTERGAIRKICLREGFDPSYVSKWKKKAQRDEKGEGIKCQGNKKKSEKMKLLLSMMNTFISILMEEYKL